MHRGDLGARAAQQPGELVLRQRVRHRRHGPQGRRRVGAQGHRDRKRRPGVSQGVVAEVERAAAVREPAHDHLVAADDLLPVDAEVLALLVRAARYHQAPGDQRAGVPGPAGLDRQTGEVDVLALPHHFLARRAADFARRHVPQRALEHRHLAERVAQPLRGFRLLEARQQFADLAQGGNDPAPPLPRRPAASCRRGSRALAWQWPVGRSNRIAGPPPRKVRSQISVISSRGETSTPIRRRSPARSSCPTKSRRSAYFIRFPHPSDGRSRK